MALPALKKNILDENPSCDVFVHTYNVTRAQGKIKGEDGTGVINASEIFLMSTDHSKIMLESEEEFQIRRNVHHYRSLFPRPSSWDYTASMDNLVRQWHSIEQVWAMMETFEEDNHQRYDIVGLLRSDVLFTHRISINESLGGGVIPQSMYKTYHSWGGYNDRMFFGKREYAECWSTERFTSLQLYLLWQQTRKSVLITGLHSEDFLRWLLVFQLSIPLRMDPICFMRIRTSGAISNDCGRPH
eukprot:CAMPEP_0172566218 /NCGR_PEP_ID=MMETSP1067-20121228/111018_1 /TAXON_ID=265564 ORGANISM="Thalassiosira punctigera, Strain Tpunct2005C2" /NCGR_SAMPLE_ID=MMETSP1067 /ASSEMBLY_ACC=CAM_ASM_000444 /LENGTH=242 /DNA_ID=CAMNT_0013357277 /DNA_START=520 /DNA_END=1248 /DNA_ORIENTATION=+